MTPDDKIEFVDSHTEGEPTRVIVSGAPNLGEGPISERLQRLRQADWFRQCVILEPRGWDAVVGAVLCQPHDPQSAAGVIFINNTGYLGMCGHGAIGVAVTLHYLGRIGLGRHLLDTPVGVVEVELIDSNQVAISNVPSYRHLQQVSVDIDGFGKVVGDVAWGGNWFFLIHGAPFPLTIKHQSQLADLASRVRTALWKQGITGEDGQEIDHIEFFDQPVAPDANSRNYVYCPGGAYDRSPCGTGTSAKLACLAADKKLAPGKMWIQESIIGSRFTASYQSLPDGKILPRIVGRAYLCSQGSLIRQAQDPFASGIGLS